MRHHTLHWLACQLIFLLAVTQLLIKPFQPAVKLTSTLGSVLCFAHYTWQLSIQVTLVLRKLPEKFGDLLSKDQLQEIEELGLLADLDDQVRPDCIKHVSMSSQGVLFASLPSCPLQLRALAIHLSMQHVSTSSCAVVFVINLLVSFSCVLWGFLGICWPFHLKENALLHLCACSAVITAKQLAHTCSAGTADSFCSKHSYSRHVHTLKLAHACIRLEANDSFSSHAAVLLPWL